MTEPLLQLSGVHTHIGPYHILHGVDFAVPAGELTMLLGRNGAGKTTTLRTIMGLWQASSGRIVFDGRDITSASTPDIARSGIAYVPEAMGIFTDLTVRENIVLAARSGPVDKNRLDWILGLFPALKRFWNLPAGNLSGGQKQMLAIARAIAEPRRLLLIDEPTKGLAPVMVRSMIEAFKALKASGETILLVEQNFYAASALGDNVVVMDDGRIVHAGAMRELVDGQEPATASARPLSGCASMSDMTADTSAATELPRAKMDWLPLLLDSGPCAPGAALRRQPLDLGDAHRRRARHGHDDLSHGLGPHPRLRPDGHHQFRPRGLHLARRLRHASRARSPGRMGAGGFRRAQSRASAALHPVRHGGDGSCRCGLRAGDRPPGLWQPSEADPRHHGRADRHRAGDPRDLGRLADPDPAAAIPARRLRVSATSSWSASASWLLSSGWWSSSACSCCSTAPASAC